MTRSELARRIAELALLRGSFTLRSGRTSSYYLDKYLFSTRPEVLGELGRMFAKVAKRQAGKATGAPPLTAPPEGGEHPIPINKLAGAELGGMPLVTAASLASGLPCVFIRNQKKEYGTGKQMEGKLEPGDRVMLVEDVCTSGGQVLEAAKVIEAAGAAVAKIVATIDRQEGAREAIEGA